MTREFRAPGATDDIISVYTTRESERTFPRSFSEAMRRWGFQAEVVVSTGLGAAALVTAEAQTKASLLALLVWALGNFHGGRSTTSPLALQLRKVASSVLLPLAFVAAAVGFVGMPEEVVPPATLAVVLAAASSALIRFGRWRLQSPVRTLLVGDRVAIAQAVARWQHQKRVRPVAALLVEPDLTEVPTEIMGVPTVTGLDAAPAIVDQFQADLVVVSPGLGFTSVDLRRLAWKLEGSKVALGVLGVLDSVAPHRITPGFWHGATLNDVRLPRPSYLVQAAKSLADRALGLFLLVIAAPILLIMSVAVRLDSKGRAIFKQTRVGLNGKHFTVYKMRTMVDNAEEIKADLADENEYDGILFKMKADPRITKIGRILRKTSLDELPQLINVVKGDMALVGPRPALPNEVAEMDADTIRRLVVKPGITGLWQVSGRSDLSGDEASALDTYYADNWSLVGDASILARTVKAVVSAKGAY